MGINIEAVEQAMAAARERLRNDQGMDSIEIRDMGEGSVNSQFNTEDLRIETQVGIGRDMATILVEPVELAASPNRVRAARCSLIRVGSTIVRTVLFRKPAIFVPDGVFLENEEKINGRKRPLMQLDLLKIFGAQKAQKELRRYLSFR